MTGATHSDRFTIADALYFGSRVFWPALLLNMVFSLPQDILAAVGWQVLAAVYAVNFAIAVFAVLPWSIRRAMRKQFSIRMLTYRESLKFSVLATFGTLGAAALPLQWGMLVPETNYWIHVLVRAAIWLGIATWTGWLLWWSLHRGFPLNVRRSC